MGVDKHFALYTKLGDGGIEGYVAKLKEHFGNTLCKKDDGAAWIYNDSLSLEEMIEEVKNGKGKTSFYMEKGGYTLAFHKRGDEPVVAEIDDSGRERFSYKELFGRYMEFAQKIGNSAYEGFSEGDTAPLARVAFDSAGKEIEGQDNIVAFARETLGLTVKPGYMDFPSSYTMFVNEQHMEKMPKILGDKGIDKHGDQVYCVGLKGNNGEYKAAVEIGIPADVKTSKDFVKNLESIVSGQDFQESLAKIRDLSRKYGKARGNYKAQDEIYKGYRPLVDKVQEQVRDCYDKAVSGDVDIKNKIVSKEKGETVFIRPEAFSRIKDENGKTTGITLSGFQAPDGKYYDVEIPFKRDTGVTVSINMKKNSKFKGWAVVNIPPGKALDMRNKEGKATVDAKAFRTFVQNKNYKIEHKNDKVFPLLGQER